MEIEADVDNGYEFRASVGAWRFDLALSDCACGYA